MSNTNNGFNHLPLTPSPSGLFGRSQSRSVSSESQISQKPKVLPLKRWSCEFCRQRKVKCDGVRPSCAFCRKRGVECVYLGQAKKDISPLASASVSQPTPLPVQDPITIPDPDPITWSATPALSNPAPLLDNLIQPTFPTPTPSPQLPSLPPPHVLILTTLRNRSRFMSFPLHRRTFLESLKDLDSINPLLRASLCAFGAEALRWGTTREQSRECYERARELSTDALESASIDTLQGLFFLCASTISAGNLSLMWMQVGMACRMAILLNLHTDPDDIEQATGTKMTWVEKEIRRRLWWNLVIGDRQMAALFKRTPNLPQKDSVKPMCSDEIWDSLKDPKLFEEAYYNRPANSEPVSHFISKMTILYSDVKLFVHETAKRMRSKNRIASVMDILSNNSPDHVQKLRALESSLEVFYSLLPAHSRIPGLTPELLAGTSHDHYVIREWHIEAFCGDKGPPWARFMIHSRYYAAFIQLYQHKVAALFQAQAQKLSSLQGVSSFDGTQIPPDTLAFVLTGFESVITFAQTHGIELLPLNPRTDASPFLRPYVMCRASAEAISFLNERALDTAPMRFPEPPVHHIETLTLASSCLMLILLHAHLQVLCAIASGKLNSIADDKTYCSMYARYMPWLRKNLQTMNGDTSGGFEGLAAEVVKSLEEVVTLFERLDPSGGYENEVQFKDSPRSAPDTLMSLSPGRRTNSPIDVQLSGKSRMFHEVIGPVKGMSQTITTMLETSKDLSSKVSADADSKKIAYQAVLSRGPVVSTALADVTNEMWYHLLTFFTLPAVGSDDGSSSSSSSSQGV